MMVIFVVVVVLLLLSIKVCSFMINHIYVSINGKSVLAKAIEWTDVYRLTPFGFMVICPHCKKEQWFQKSTLYIAYDNSPNNLRCLYCHVGKQPKRLFDTPNYNSHPNFSPKSWGWKSLEKDNYLE